MKKLTSFVISGGFNTSQTLRIRLKDGTEFSAVSADCTFVGDKKSIISGKIVGEDLRVRKEVAYPPYDERDYFLYWEQTFPISLVWRVIIDEETFAVHKKEGEFFLLPHEI